MDNRFRTLQAVSDLIHHVKPLLSRHLAAVAKASKLSIPQTGEAFRRLRDDGYRFDRDETLRLRDGLEILAATLGEGLDLAVVVLLADNLQRQQPSGLLAETWAAVCRRPIDWPPTLRAAVGNGMLHASQSHLLQLDQPPTQANCLTRGADEVAEPLLRVARSMHRHELDAIARTDHGLHADANLEALIETIAQRSGIWPPDGHSAIEVVTLVSFDPKSPGFAGCTAILLLNALKQGRHDGLHWMKYGAAYCGLKPSQRDAILAGYRYIYEFDQSFMGAVIVQPTGRLGEGTTIPVVDEL